MCAFCGSLVVGQAQHLAPLRRRRHAATGSRYPLPSVRLFRKTVWLCCRRLGGSLGHGPSATRIVETKLLAQDEDLATKRAAVRAPQGPAFPRVVSLSTLGPWSDSVPAWAPRSRLLDFFRGRYPPVDTDVHSRAFPRLRRRLFGEVAASARGRAGPQRPTGCRRGAASRAGAGRRPRGSGGGLNAQLGRWAVLVSASSCFRERISEAVVVPA